MTINEFKEDILKSEPTYRFKLLSRLQQDCEYFLGAGAGSEKVLWGGTVEEHIEYMKALYEILSEAGEEPEWLTLNKINEYETNMKNMKNLNVTSLIKKR